MLAVTEHQCILNVLVDEVTQYGCADAVALLGYRKQTGPDHDQGGS